MVYIISRGYEQCSIFSICFSLLPSNILLHKSVNPSYCIYKLEYPSFPILYGENAMAYTAPDQKDIKINIFCISPQNICYEYSCWARWLSWMRRPTGDQEVAGSTPTEVGNILSRKLIVKYFLRSFADSRRAVISFWRKNVHNTG